MKTFTFIGVDGISDYVDYINLKAKDLENAWEKLEGFEGNFETWIPIPHTKKAVKVFKEVIKIIKSNMESEKNG